MKVRRLEQTIYAHPWRWAVFCWAFFGLLFAVIWQCILPGVAAGFPFAVIQFLAARLPTERRRRVVSKREEG